MGFVLFLQAALLGRLPALMHGLLALALVCSMKTQSFVLFVTIIIDFVRE